MKNRNLAIALASLLALATGGCDRVFGLVDSSYTGEPLFEFRARVSGERIESGAEILPAIYWLGAGVSSGVRFDVDKNFGGLGANIEIITPPPRRAFRVVKNGGGDLYARARIVLFEDLDGDRSWDRADEPLRGGANGHAIVFYDGRGTRLFDSGYALADIIPCSERDGTTSLLEGLRLRSDSPEVLLDRSSEKSFDEDIDCDGVIDDVCLDPTLDAMNPMCYEVLDPITPGSGDCEQERRMFEQVEADLEESADADGNVDPAMAELYDEFRRQYELCLGIYSEHPPECDPNTMTGEECCPADGTFYVNGQCLRCEDLGPFAACDGERPCVDGYILDPGVEYCVCADELMRDPNGNFECAGEDPNTACQDIQGASCDDLQARGCVQLSCAQLDQTSCEQRAEFGCYESMEACFDPANWQGEQGRACCEMFAMQNQFIPWVCHDLLCSVADNSFFDVNSQGCVSCGSGMQDAGECEPLFCVMQPEGECQTCASNFIAGTAQTMECAEFICGFDETGNTYNWDGQACSLP